VINKILNFLYYKNYFRLAVYFSKFFSLFDNNIKKRISFYNYFKKRKKIFRKDTLEILCNPKVFIIKFPENTEKIINQIYKYDKLYKKNQFSNDGHVNVYQSEHNLNQNSEFQEISNKLEKFINLKLQKFINFNKLTVDKLWFVITKNSGIIKKHSHFNSDFSGAFYLNVEEDTENRNGLKLYNTLENLEIFSYSLSGNQFNIEVTNEKTLLLKPKKNDLIIFNSYLEHSVDNENSKINERISLPFDLIF
jgi:uncharacterized protein (TIGR02466 family)